MSKPIQIIMIDNFDSFTYNLVDQFRQLNIKVLIFRNNTPINAIFTEKNLNGYQNIIVLSPGPGNPDTAGNTLEIIKRFAHSMPILGVCLGHQALVQAFGGGVGSAKEIVHGKAGKVKVEKHPIFNQLGDNFQVARYHSLAATTLPQSLECIASTEEQNHQKEVMAVAHETLKIVGLQFHPESILTTNGKLILKNAIGWLTQ